MDISSTSPYIQGISPYQSHMNLIFPAFYMTFPWSPKKWPVPPLRFHHCEHLPPPPRAKGDHHAHTERLTRDVISWAKLWQDLKKPMLFRHLADQQGWSDDASRNMEAIHIYICIYTPLYLYLCLYMEPKKRKARIRDTLLFWDVLGKAVWNMNFLGKRPWFYGCLELLRRRISRNTEREEMQSTSCSKFLIPWKLWPIFSGSPFKSGPFKTFGPFFPKKTGLQCRAAAPAHSSSGYGWDFYHLGYSTDPTKLRPLRPAQPGRST